MYTNTQMKLQLPDGRISEILIGEKLANLPKYITSDKVFIITDSVVYNLYNSQFPKNCEVIIISMGEPNKTLDTVLKAVRLLISAGADRSSYIIGIGGGIVCDITGFIASIYMRGVKFGFAPTTLLAQVDASVGGKNGVNCDGYKNMIGVFNQPDFVLCDAETLKTLPPRELRAGLAEVVKAGLIADKDLFSYIEQHFAAILNCDTQHISHIVDASVKIKANIVERDEKEAGERQKLNLGHTFGHAVEKHSSLLHGEAVSIGMVIAAQISAQLGLLSQEQYARIETLLTNIELPVNTDISIEKLIEAVSHDKKKHGETLNFILNKGIGEAEVRQLRIEDFGLRDFCFHN